MSVDWQAAPNALQPVTTGQQGATFGLDLGQKLAQVHALQGVDFNNPDSINASVSKLVHANALDQAGALQNLGVARAFYSQVLPHIESMFGGDQGQPPAQPAQPATQSSDQQAPADPQAVAQAKQQQIMGEASQAVAKLQATPLADRPAVADQIKQQFLDHGVPEPAVDEALSDLSDAGLAKTAAFYQQHQNFAAQQSGQPVGPQGTATSPAVGALDGMTAPVGQEAPPAAQGGPQTAQADTGQAQAPATAPDHPTGYAWADRLLNNPAMNDPMTLALAKKFGIDMEPILQRAQALEMPYITQAANLAYAGPIAAATSQAQLPAEIAKMTIAKQIEVATAGKIAGEVATAQEAAKAPWAFTQVMGPDGQPVWMRNDYLAQKLGENGGTGITGISPSGQAFQTAQANQAADILKPDIPGYQSAQQNEVNARRLLGIIDNIKFNQATPIMAQVAAAARTAGFPGADKFATDIAGYNQLSAQSLMAVAKQSFPGRITDRDTKLAANVVPGLTTPNDQSKVVVGMQGAGAEMAQEYEQFKSTYNGPKNPQAIEQAWLASPHSSILAQPIWTHILIGGQPMLQLKTVNGQKWFAWGAGTGHPQYFQQGQ